MLSLYARGLTTGEISAHFAQIYGASVSKETVSRITDKVIEEMTSWAGRPLDWGRHHRGCSLRHLLVDRRLVQRHRRHSKIGYLSPLQYERQLATQAA